MNAENATNWLPGLLALAGGVAAALVYLLASKKPEGQGGDAGTQDDLETRYQARLAELKEHTANKHLFPADVWAKEHARLELAAAAALRERDGKRHETLKAQARAEKLAEVKAQAPATGAKNPAFMGAVIGGAVVAFFALLGYQLSASATARAPDGSMTGGPGPGAMQGPPPRDTKLEGLAARVQAAPDDGEAVADLAVHLIRQQAFAEARPLVARAVMIDPYLPKARVGRAVMRAFDGDPNGATSELELLAARYPEAYDGHMFAGMLSLDLNDPRRALKNFEAFVAIAPADDQPPMIRMVAQQIRQELAGAPQP